MPARRLRILYGLYGQTLFIVREGPPSKASCRSPRFATRQEICDLLVLTERAEANFNVVPRNKEHASRFAPDSMNHG